MPATYYQTSPSSQTRRKLLGAEGLVTGRQRVVITVVVAVLVLLLSYLLGGIGDSSEPAQSATVSAALP